jgi:uncharacterized DUF497 family protein
MKIRISFDPNKNARNIVERGLPFTRVEDFDWATALIAEDKRKDYAEIRHQALGYIDEHLYVLICTFRGNTLHIISLRRANQRERNRYATQIQS